MDLVVEIDGINFNKKLSLKFQSFKELESLPVEGEPLPCH